MEVRGLGAKENKFKNKKLKWLFLQKKPFCEEVTVMFGENLKFIHYFTKIRQPAVTVLQILRDIDILVIHGQLEEERLTGQL